MTDQKRILELSVKLGELLLVNGAEIFRVQDTMEHVFKAYKAHDYHVYILTNGVFASVIDDEQKAHNAELRHVPNASVHLGRIVAINSLSRGIASGAVSLDEAFIKADEISELPYTKTAVKLVACSVGAGCFAYLFGGSVFDAFAACFAGLFLQVFWVYGTKHPMGKIVTNILGAALVALVSFILISLGIGDNLDKIIIGGIIPLVPGMALTTAIRDFANSDYLSGTIRLMDTLLIGGSIAIGIAFMLKIIGLATGVTV